MKLITFLGTGRYGETRYYFDELGKEKGILTPYVQEALIKCIEDIDEVIVIVTEESEKINWCNSDKRDLKTIFEELMINYKVVKIPSGKTQNELWEMFATVYDNVAYNDEIIVDITHSFRSIPIMISSVLNFSKDIKNIKIKDVLYGAYEAKDNENNSPIFSLNIYNELLNWSKGVSDLVNSGNYSPIQQQLNKSLNPLLKKARGKSEELNNVRYLATALEEFFSDLKLARGVSGPKKGHEIKNRLEEIDIKECEKYESLRPFILVINQLEKPFDHFDGDLVNDVYACIKLCIQYGLYQQAYTLLRENVVNAVCIEAELDYCDEKEREKAETLIYYNLDWSKFNKINKIVLTDEEEALNNKMKMSLDGDKAMLFKEISDYRNDLNHAEFRLHPQQKKKIIKKMTEFSDAFYEMYLREQSVNEVNNA